MANLEDDEPSLGVADDDVKFDICKKLDYGGDETKDEAKPTETPIADQMKVYLRIRPFSTEELQQHENQNCVKVESEHLLMASAPRDSNTFKNAQHRLGKGISQKFTFSKIFTESTNQKLFFDEAVLGTVKEFVNGQNCLMFTYGVTNSGKTYTVQGIPKDVGILPRSLDVIFNSIHSRQWEGPTLKPHMFCDVVRLRSTQEEEERKLKNLILKQAEADEHEIDMTVNMSRMTADSTMSEDSLMMRNSLASSTISSSRDSGELCELLPPDRNHEDTTIDIESQGDIKFSIWVSFAEIYNENIHDLLEPLTKKKNPKARIVLQLREDKHGNPYVRGLKEILVTSADEAYKLLTVGKKNLHIACTKLNRQSSRSHCIFTIKMLRVVDKEHPNVARMSMLSFCDLAGSERYTKTGNTGELLKQSGNINTSLLTLGRCIQILRHNQTNKDHPQVVPFRESKLTRQFQSFFCGKGRASMIVNINQNASTFDETLHALKYSAIAKQIIVVQEPEKPKKQPQTGRQFSMLLNQSSRQTIGWATPGTCAKVFQEEAALEEGEEDEEEDGEETASETEREKELVELLEQMKNQLIKEKRKQLLLEAKIREEVCKEMSQQLVEIEAHYSQRLKREQAYQEEKAERRMEILTQSVLKSRKRQRIFEDNENEELVSSVLLHAEQIKVQKCEKDIEEIQDELATLTTQNEQLREAANIAMKERDTLQKENTSVKFQISDLEIKMEKSENSRSRLDNSMDQSTVSESGDLSKKLAQTEAELDKQKQSVTKLQQVIDMLQCNAADVASGDSKLRKDLEKAKQELTERDTKIEEMQQLYQKQDEQLDQLNSDLEKQQKENDALVTMMETLRSEISNTQTNYDQLQANNTERDGNETQLKHAMDDAQKQLDTQRDDHEKALNQWQTDREGMESQLAELKETIEQFETEKAGIKRQLEEAQDLVEQRETELEKVKMALESQSDVEGELVSLREDLANLEKEKDQQATELQAALDLQKEYEAMEQSKDKELESVFAMQDQLKEELKTVKNSFQEAELKSAELKSQLESLNNEKKDLESVVDSKEEENKAGIALQQELKAEMAELKAGLEETRNQLEVAGSEHLQEVSALRAKIAGLEVEADSVEDGNELSKLTEKLTLLAQQVDEKQTKVQQLEKLLLQANESSDSAQKSVKKLTKDLENEKKLHKESKTELEDYVLKVNEQIETIGSLGDQLKMKEKAMEEVQQELDGMRGEKLSGDGELKKMETELKIQQDLLDRENDKFESRIAEYDVQIKDLQQKLEESARRGTKLRDTIADTERKYNSLQVSMEIMTEETEAEREEHDDVLNKTRLDTQEKSTRITDLENELEHLKTVSSGQNRDKTEAEAEIECLKRSVSEMELKVNDTEYNHQISCRQLKREKANVEKLLKVAEEGKEEAEKRGTELQEELAVVRGKITEIERDQGEIINKHKARAEKLEAVVKDLEMCLKSSKDHEAKSIKEIDSAKQKCRRLETECNNKEDTICSLTDEIERFREESVMAANLSNSENTAQMESLRHEVMDCKKDMDDLEFELRDVKEEKILVERESESKLGEAEVRIKDLEMMNSELESKIAKKKKVPTATLR